MGFLVAFYRGKYKLKNMIKLNNNMLARRINLVYNYLFILLNGSNNSVDVVKFGASRLITNHSLFKDKIRIPLYKDPLSIKFFKQQSRGMCTTTILKVNQNVVSKGKFHKEDICKDLVLWGNNLGSTVGTGRLTKVEREMIKLAPLQFGVIIGLLLSDGWLTLSSEKSLNARLGFKQSLAQSTYVFHVFNLLSHYCSSLPNLTTSVRAGHLSHGVQFFTRALPCFTELHSLFYPHKTKIIPINIYDLLTPVALAHLIMGDGEAREHGLVLCTNSFSVQDVVRLMNVLIIRYRLECIIRLKKQNNKTEYLIYIRQGSMPLLRSIVVSYLHPSMYYKVKLAE